MMKTRTVAALAFLLAGSLACSNEPATCEEAACDAETQYCQFLGSDVIGEPDSASCVEIPAECEATPTCECIHGDAFGTCSVEDGLVVVVIPGG